MWTIFKIFIKFLTILLLLFVFWFFWPQAMWESHLPNQGLNPYPLRWKAKP